ncbi:MAG: efflux RND transporter permease subunit [Sphingomonadaceae bacterium]|nr:efflux RND transporter permease subunit [Sphingomonadaceae bacterium]
MTDEVPGEARPASPDGAPVLDRYGQVTTERARDRKGIIAFMARNGVAANLLLMSMVIAGYFAFTTISQEVFPEGSLERVSVTLEYPGATPEEVEESIVQKVEEAVQSIEGVKKVTSVAAEGAGTVVIELQYGTSVERALDDVKSEIDQIQTFPLEAEEPNIREMTNRQSAMRIAIFGDAPEATLKETAYQLEDALSALDEISFVDTSAIRKYQIYIDVPQDRLRALGLSLNDISQVVAAGSLDSPAGAIKTTTEQVRVRTVGQNYNQTDFEDIIVVSEGDGATLRIRDIANVSDGFEDNDVITRFNDQPVAFVDVYRTSDERVLDVAEAARTHLTEEFSETLPHGVQYAIFDDGSDIFNQRLGLLMKNALIGLVLVLAALTLFLDIRLAALTAVGIAGTFIGAIFILEQLGSTLNMFSLFGFVLALGLVVDDAVVVGENVYAERERGRSGVGAAIAGAQRVAMPVIFAVITTIVSFSPIFAVGGLMGKIFRDVPLVVIAVLSLSLLEALLILPFHLSSLPAHGTKAKNKVLRKLHEVQVAFDKHFQSFVAGPLDRMLRFAVSMPYMILACASAVLIVTFATIPSGLIKFGFFPDIEADSVKAQLEMPAGTKIERTEKVVQKIEAAGKRAVERLTSEIDPDAPFLDATYTTVGMSVANTGPLGVNQTVRANLASLELKLVSAELRDISAKQLEDTWREELGPVPEVRSLSISSSLIRIGDPVSVKLSHPNEQVLKELGRKLTEKLAAIGGVYDIENDQDAGMQEIELRLRPSARTLGISLRDVASQVRAAFFGAEAVRVQRGREDVRVYVRLPENERDSIADVENFRVLTPGGSVALSALAEASFSQSPSVIRREGGRRITTVSAEVDKDVVTSDEVSALLQAEIMPQLVRDYPDLQFHLGGVQEEQEQSFSRLGPAFLLAMITIYALLAIPFRSYVKPLIIMAAIPFGMIGAIFGHLLLGIPLSILSMFGIIALSGVVINGSLVLLDFIDENLRNGMEREEAIIDAAKSRFRPILLTALTTFIGVAPITFETSLQAQFLIPMSASLGFGVLFGTVLLQLIVPALSILQMRASDRIFGRRDREPA